jgi:hypothetical protein
MAIADRLVLRFNFFEFVRVRFDGQQFANQNGQAEGSRASSKIAWRSRTDVVKDPASGLWVRNNVQPPGEVENEIALGHKPLTQNAPMS